MAKLLHEYRNHREQLQQKTADVTIGDLRVYGELTYRISVLESMEFLLQKNPTKEDMQAFVIHYQLFDALVAQLLGERRCMTSDQNQAKNCLAAYQNLQVVRQDYLRKFSGCATTGYTAEQYHTDISNAIQVVLIAWISYRNTLIPIQKENAT